MEYPKTDEEFYSMISKTINEIVYTNNFPISLEEKKKLWFLTYETAQRYEEQKQIDLVGASKRLSVAFEDMYKSLEGLFSTIEKSQPLIEKLERTVVEMGNTKARMQEISENIKNATLKAQKVLENIKDTENDLYDTSEMIKRIKEKNRYLEARLKDVKKGKMDIGEYQEIANEVNETINDIFEKMKNQGNQNP
jgi:methyl-accepting chemotaxis protein